MSSNNKRNRIFYWIFTLLVLLPTAVSGVLELFTAGPESVIQSLQQNFQTLGYPLYLMKILGLAKILGSIAILSDKSAKLKEWAYAGFTFEFLGATASSVLEKNWALAPVPFVFFLVLMGSYYFWNKTAKRRQVLV